MTIMIVLTGAACSGKTTTINALKEKLKNEKNIHFIDEVATKYITAEQKAGREPFANLIKFERTVMVQQAQEEDALLDEDACIILDRSLIDDLAITEMLEVGKAEHLDIAGEVEVAARARHYDSVFILQQLPFVQANFRLEKNAEEAKRQDKFIRDTYERLRHDMGYKIINLPLVPVEERVELIIREVRRLQGQARADAVSVAKIGLFGKPALPTFAGLGTEKIRQFVRA